MSPDHYITEDNDLTSWKFTWCSRYGWCCNLRVYISSSSDGVLRVGDGRVLVARVIGWLVVGLCVHVFCNIRHRGVGMCAGRVWR